MNRTLFAALLVLSLSACQRNASDQPETTATDTTVTPATTAETTPPSDSESSDAAATTGAVPETATTDTTGTTGDASGGTGAGGMDSTTTGVSDATLEADLRRCDTMSGTERTTCRAEAQTRYNERIQGTQDTP